MTPVTAIHPPPGSGPYGPQVQREAVRRSWLVIAPRNEEQLTSVVMAPDGASPDVVVLDLEDGVHASRKAEARSNIKRWLEVAARGGAEVFVRAGLDSLRDDLEAAVWYGITGVVLPKVDAAWQVAQAEHLIAEFERQRGLPGVLELHLSLETLAGNFHTEELIRASKRVRSVSLGRIDVVEGLSAEPTTGELHRLPFLLQRLVVLARAGGIEPIGAWWQAGSRGTVASPEETLTAAVRARRNGLRGGLCFKPEQVTALNRGFTPTVEDVARATRIVDAYQGRGRGAVVDGHMVSAALATAAEGLLDYAELCRQRDENKRSVSEASA